MVATTEATPRQKIISRGRAVLVSDAELDELRAKFGPHGWYRYCQLRITMTHAQAVAAMS